MNSTGLIGHTGFVGGTLLRATGWDACYNSTNIENVRGQEFDLLLCAGVTATKWMANKEPEADRAGIARLTNALSSVRAKELILISTIDVYSDLNGGDEHTVINPAVNHAYGRHRLALENWAAEHFPLLRIVRLPALFGAGLRKNVIYDLLHGNMLQNINPSGIYQWYPMDRLWQDIGIARANNLPVVNLCTEPLPMSRIINGMFPGAVTGPEQPDGPSYNVQTRYGRLFGGDGRYMMNQDAILAAMAAFVNAECTA